MTTPTDTRTRHFYSDSLAAAWMAKYFGMRFISWHSAKEYEIAVIESNCGSPIRSIRDDQRYVIHPDSLHLLEPKVGDLFVGDRDALYRADETLYPKKGGGWEPGVCWRVVDCHNRAVETLHGQGLSPKQIAQVVNKTERSVIGKINRNDGLAKKDYHYDRHDDFPAPKTFDVGPNSPWGVVRSTLGPRVRRLDDGFLLDGNIAGFYACVREANRVRKALGLNQIVGSPEWVV